MAIGDTVNAGLMRTDFSAFQQAGLANAQANAAFGNAVGSFIDSYYKKKQEKVDREEMASNLVRNFGMERDAADAMSRDKDLLPLYYKNEAQKREAQQNEKLFALRKKEYEGREADRKILGKFSGDLLSETTDPKVVEQVEEVRPGMFALGNETQRNRFLDFQQEQQPKVAVGELGSSEFARVAREREFDPTLAGQRFMGLQKAEAAQEDKRLAELGDQFSSRLGSISPYYFSESDAVNDIRQQAIRFGIDLDKDQIDLALKSQRIVDTKDLRAEALKQIKATRIDESVSILEAGEQMENFLSDGSALSATIAKEKLARMIQPDGILTEDDLNRVGGSKGLTDRIARKIQEILDGTADEKTVDDLRSAANIFKASARKKINVEHPQIIKYLSETFEISPQDTVRRTALDRYKKHMPKVSQSSGDISPTSPPPPAISTSTLPSGGRFTPAQSQ